MKIIFSRWTQMTLLPTPVVWILGLTSIGLLIYSAYNKSLTKDQQTKITMFQWLLFVIVIANTYTK